MARIRTIKPETWTSEQIMNLTPIARLAFIGMWNFCDDGGNHPASARTLKAEVFPADDIATSDVEGLVEQMEQQNLVVGYEAGGKAFWHVTGWHHQRIDKPTFKHPRFEDSSANTLAPIEEPSTNPRRALHEPSASTTSALAPGVEGKGMEGSGVDEEGNNSAVAEPSSAGDNCPHQQIIDLFHEHLPTGVRVREWTPARQQALRTRWREKPERQSLDWWARFFKYVQASDFLTGRVKPSSGRKSFELRLDWLCKSENLVKVIEGCYEN